MAIRPYSSNPTHSSPVWPQMLSERPDSGVQIKKFVQFEKHRKPGGNFFAFAHCSAACLCVIILILGDANPPKQKTETICFLCQSFVAGSEQLLASRQVLCEGR